MTWERQRACWLGGVCVFWTLLGRYSQTAVSVDLSFFYLQRGSKRTCGRCFTKNLLSSPLFSFLHLSLLSQCLFRTSPWGRPSGVLLFRTSSCLIARLCLSHCRRRTTPASSPHRSTSSHPTGLNPASSTDSVILFANHCNWFYCIGVFTSQPWKTDGVMGCCHHPTKWASG